MSGGVGAGQNEALTDGLGSIFWSVVSSKRPWRGETPPSGLVPALPSLHTTSTTRTPGRLVERPKVWVRRTTLRRLGAPSPAALF